MNQKKVETNDPKKNAAVAPPDVDFFAEGDREWNETGLRLLYKPDHFIHERLSGSKSEVCWKMVDGKKVYTSPLICGYPISCEAKESDYEGQDHFLIIGILLTRPCMVLTGDAKTPARVEKGQTLIVIGTSSLQRVGLLARLPEHSVEVQMRPIQKDDIGGGHMFWRWSVRENPTPVPRVLPAGEDILAKLAQSEAAEKQLSNGATPVALGTAEQSERAPF